MRSKKVQVKKNKAKSQILLNISGNILNFGDIVNVCFFMVRLCQNCPHKLWLIYSHSDMSEAGSFMLFENIMIAQELVKSISEGEVAS